MTNSYPPYGGQQPDPNVNPQWGQPAQPGPYPGYGQPGQPPQFGAPVPPPKSNKGLIIGLSAGAAVVLLALCGGGVGLFLAAGDDKPDPVASSSGNPVGPSADPSGGGPESETPAPDNNAVTARYSSDMSSVCDGSPILNAAPYTAGSPAKAYTFANSPDRPSYWSSKSISSAKPYYSKSADFESVAVVGCLKVVEGSEGAPKKCDYKNNDGKIVTVSYISSRYELTFYAAKTGEKIGDGGTVSAPANRCPSFISYNKLTMKSYASPDSGTIEAALDKFLF
ncbi:hypothetical protein GCM10010169_41790 [Micromonospora fulviviridis]|uniref:hypothetical protein n=1 Tax=Micromonospora fulviviridis TaxID=47860 RepID=UPI00166A5EC7|nr:hypothetical protein [Micromonospora fulviviridis]GGR93055.1 hypothetical protein GCM10010169_41790 [Micromonospora fulviviridis]